MLVGGSPEAIYSTLRARAQEDGEAGEGCSRFPAAQSAPRVTPSLFEQTHGKLVEYRRNTWEWIEMVKCSPAPYILRGLSSTTSSFCRVLRVPSDDLMVPFHFLSFALYSGPFWPLLEKSTSDAAICLQMTAEYPELGQFQKSPPFLIILMCNLYFLRLGHRWQPCHRSSRVTFQVAMRRVVRLRSGLLALGLQFAVPKIRSFAVCESSKEQSLEQFLKSNKAFGFRSSVQT